MALHPGTLVASLKFILTFLLKALFPALNSSIGIRRLLSIPSYIL